METLVKHSLGTAFRGRRVLVTGHTGFKGAWLCEWLLLLGAKVTGFALPAPTQPSLFERLGLERRITHVEGDVRDLARVCTVMEEAEPEYIFHLAAQSLVRRSYAQPVETYSTNVMGTVNILEAVRLANRPCVVVAVTTDKCYENKEWMHSYREEDPMGGLDPYSSSKGAAELVISAYRRSYFSTPSGAVRLASTRAGNVIGGGDWASDRIVPDCVRSLECREAIQVRNKHATRPWQHVLEPLSGYLWLGARLANERTEQGASLAGGFNFGPSLGSNRTVGELVEEVLKHWPGSWEDHSVAAAPHEAKFLNLAIDKAWHMLGWTPVWAFSQTVEETMNWYLEAANASTNIVDLTQSQIASYTRAAVEKNLSWSR